MVCYYFKEKVGNLGVRVSEKIDKELFDAILKASKPVKKKKSKKKKKVHIYFTHKKRITIR